MKKYLILASIYFFIEKGLRGGISYITKRYAKANNKYINGYDPKKHSTFISHIDMNNLYGWAMSEYLPYERFKWSKNIDKFDVMLISEKSLIGYFLEVDIEYPDKFHKLHNDYPLAAEKLAVSSDMMSKYCKKIAEKYLSLGMKLNQIHRVLQFKQSDWMKNISILTLKKEWMLLMILKKIFLNGWSILFMEKQWKSYEQ